MRRTIYFGYEAQRLRNSGIIAEVYCINDGSYIAEEDLLLLSLSSFLKVRYADLRVKLSVKN